MKWFGLVATYIAIFCMEVVRRVTYLGQSLAGCMSSNIISTSVTRTSYKCDALTGIRSFYSFELQGLEFILHLSLYRPTSRYQGVSIRPSKCVAAWLLSHLSSLRGYDSPSTATAMSNEFASKSRHAVCRALTAFITVGLQSVVAMGMMGFESGGLELDDCFA